MKTKHPLSNGHKLQLRANKRNPAESIRFAEAVLDATKQPLVVLDNRLRIASANRVFLETFHLKGPEIQFEFLYRIADGQWNIPPLKKRLKEIIENRSKIENFEVQFDTPLKTQRTMAFNAKPLIIKNVSSTFVLLEIEDITKRKKAENEIAEWAKFPTENPNPVLRLSTKGNLLVANKASAALLREWGSNIGGKPPDFFTNLVAASFKSRKKKTADVECGGRYYSFDIVPIPKSGYINLYGTDITERKKIEEALARSNRKLTEVLNSIQDDFYVLDHEWNFIYANKQFTSRIGKEPNDLAGINIWKLFPKHVGTAFEENLFATMEKGEIRRFEVNGKYTDAWYAMTAFPSAEGITVLGTDITQRRRAEEALRESEERLRSLYASMIEGLANHEIVYKDGRAVDYLITDVNPAFERITGLTRQSTVGRKASELYGLEDPPFLDVYSNVASGGEPFYFESFYPPMKKHFAISVFSPGKGKFATVFSDISERKKREEELRRLNRTLKALSNSSQAMMMAANESEYLVQVCKIIIDDCGYALVWIGFAEDDKAKTIRPVAYAGFEKGYLETLKLTWADTERGRGPTGTSIRTGKPSQCANMLTDPKFKPWREEAIKRGYASSVVVPLIAEGKTFGAVTIYSQNPDSFSSEEIGLLSELAEDLSFGIQTIRLRAAQAKVEETLRETNAYLKNLIDNANAPIIVWDPNFRITRFNHAFEHLTGFPHAEVNGRRLDVLFPPESKDASMSRIRQTLQGETWDSVEIPILCRDGGTRIALWNSANIYAADNRTLLATIAQGQDITERKRFEEALLISEIRYRRLFEAARDGILILDADSGRIVDVNPFIKDMLGYSHEEFVDKKLWEIGLFKHIAASKESFLELQAKGFIRYENLPLETKDGRQIAMEFVSNVYLVDGKKVIQCNIRDITQRVLAEEALRESEEKYRTLIETADDVILLTDMNGKHLLRNKSYYTSLGYDVEETIDLDGFAIVHPDDKPIIQNLMKDLIERGTLTSEYRVRNKQGEWIFRSAKSSIIRDNEGRPQNILAIIRDITERKKIETALKESEERYKLAQQAAGIGTWDWDIRTGRMEWSKDVAGLFGISLDRFDGSIEAFRDLIHPDDRNQVGTAINACLEEGNEFRIMHRVNQPDGAIRWLIERGNVIRNEKNLAVRMLAVVIDITAMRKANEEISRLAEIVHASWDGIVTYTLEGIVTHWNPGAERMYGYVNDEMIGRSITEIIPEESRKEISEILEKVKKGKRISYHETIRHTKSGKQINVSLAFSPIKDASGKVAALSSIERDITHRKQIEEALKKSMDELDSRVKERTAELQKVNQLLQAEVVEREERQRQLRSLSAMLAKTEERERRRIATDLHDRIIQTLVYANMRMSELREASPATGASTAVNEVSQYIQQTIKDLRTLTFELSPPVLYELGFVSAVKWLIRQFEEKHDLAIEFQEHDVSDAIDENVRIVIFQALREFFNNVVKHAKAQSVKVTLYRDHDMLRTIVEDDGIGFDFNQLRLNTDTNSGFGMFNIRERLEYLNGRMDVESRPGNGTRIELIVPIQE